MKWKLQLPSCTGHIWSAQYLVHVVSDCCINYILDEDRDT